MADVIVRLKEFADADANAAYHSGVLALYYLLPTYLHERHDGACKSRIGRLGFAVCHGVLGFIDWATRMQSHGDIMEALESKHITIAGELKALYYLLPTYLHERHDGACKSRIGRLGFAVCHGVLGFIDWATRMQSHGDIMKALESKHITLAGVLKMHTSGAGASAGREMPLSGGASSSFSSSSQACSSSTSSSKEGGDEKKYGEIKVLHSSGKDPVLPRPPPPPRRYYSLAIAIPQTFFLKDSSTIWQWRRIINIRRPRIHGLHVCPRPTQFPLGPSYVDIEDLDLLDEISECWTNLVSPHADFEGLVRREYRKHGGVTGLSQNDYVRFTLDQYRNMDLLPTLDGLVNGLNATEYHRDRLFSRWGAVTAGDLWTALKATLGVGPCLEFLRVNYGDRKYFYLNEVRVIYEATDENVDNFRAVENSEVPGEGIGWVTDGSIRDYTTVYIPAGEQLHMGI